MEIERKFLIKNLPENLDLFTKYEIKQTYICTDPVMRIREVDTNGGTYIFTFKGKGTVAKEEFEYPLTKEQFENLWKKSETKKIVKTRHLVPIQDNLIAELDIYKDDLEGFMNVEVEFDTIIDSHNFIPPDWFGEEVTENINYSNAYMSIYGIPVKK